MSAPEIKPAPLETDMPLVSFGDFSRAVPERWRKAPLYICRLGQTVKARALMLGRDSAGARIITICEDPIFNPPKK